MPGRPEAHPSFFCAYHNLEWCKDGQYIKIIFTFYVRREFIYIINYKGFIGCIFKLLNEKISPKIKLVWNGI